MDEPGTGTPTVVSLGHHQWVPTTPLERLTEGSALLAPLLTARGYRMDEPETGSGSGGPLARVTWRRDGQHIETHVRGALGIVKYCCGKLDFLHQDYLRWRGVHGAYPGFSDVPLDGFRHLLDDLLGPAAEVLGLTDEDFAEVAAGVAAMTPPRLP